MKTPLNGYNLSAEKVIAFNTHGVYGVGSGFGSVEKLYQGCPVLEGIPIKSGLESDGVYLAIKDEKETEARIKVLQ